MVLNCPLLLNCRVRFVVSGRSKRELSGPTMKLEDRRRDTASCRQLLDVI